MVGCVGLPGPRQKLIQAVCRVACDHAGENIAKPSVGLDAVELGGFDQRADNGPTVAATVTASEQMVLAAEGYRPNRTLDRIGVEFTPAVLEEAGEPLRAAECIAGGIRERAARGNENKLSFKLTAHGEQMRCGLRRLDDIRSAGG
jgi:hypothetical protein